MIAGGPHRGFRFPGKLHELPGQLPLLVLYNWTEHLHTRAVVWGWSSREPHRIHRVGAGVLPVETHHGHRGC